MDGGRGRKVQETRRLEDWKTGDWGLAGVAGGFADEMGCTVRYCGGLGYS